MRAASTIITVATSGEAPLHQLLGSDSLSFAISAVETLTADLGAGCEPAVGTGIIDVPST